MNLKSRWWVWVVLATLTLACRLTSVAVQEPTASPPTPASPPPTATPVPPTEVPTSTPVPGQVISQASGACRHPYYPVRSDTTWRYQTRVGEDSPTPYAVTYDDIGADAFTSRQTFPGSTAESTWLCSDAGLIPGELASFLPVQIPNFEFRTLGHSGALLPPPGEWAAGATWQTGYRLQVTTRVLGIPISSGADLSVENQIVGVEELVLPAGSYPQAVRIDSTGAARADATGSETQVGFSFSHWYVEGVGLVKISADVQGTAFDMELVSIE